MNPEPCAPTINRFDPRLFVFSRMASQGTGADVPQADAHGYKNNGELGDLRDSQAGQKTGALAVAHVPHDGHHNQRVSNKHKQRQSRGVADLGAQVDDKEQK